MQTLKEVYCLPCPMHNRKGNVYFLNCTGNCYLRHRKSSLFLVWTQYVILSHLRILFSQFYLKHKIVGTNDLGVCVAWLDTLTVGLPHNSFPIKYWGNIKISLWKCIKTSSVLTCVSFTCYNCY